MTDIITRLSGWMLPNPALRRAVQDAITEIEQLRADAARWRYVRDHLATQMKGDSFSGDEDEWHFYPVSTCHEESLEEIMDRLIAEKSQDGPA